MVVDADLSRKFIQLNGEQLNGRGLVGSFFLKRASQYLLLLSRLMFNYNYYSLYSYMFMLYSHVFTIYRVLITKVYNEK